MRVGVSFAMPPKMRFADDTGAVARVLDIADVALPMSEFRISESPDAVLMNLIPGHQAGTGGHAYWRAGAALAKHGALGGQLVQMRRNGYGIARVAHGVCSLLIAEDKNYVWF